MLGVGLVGVELLQLGRLRGAVGHGGEAALFLGELFFLSSQLRFQRGALLEALGLGPHLLRVLLRGRAGSAAGAASRQGEAEGLARE
jgi:hypothetical protein